MKPLIGSSGLRLAGAGTKSKRQKGEKTRQAQPQEQQTGARTADMREEEAGEELLVRKKG
jgi:hypothetical protein